MISLLRHERGHCEIWKRVSSTATLVVSIAQSALLNVERHFNRQESRRNVQLQVLTSMGKFRFYLASGQLVPISVTP